MNRRGSARHPSIINAVLGPVMIGPSSSHLAGPLRIGRLAHSIIGGPARRVGIAFNEGGSLAGTYRGHRTDCALVAGVLGWETHDERIPSALHCARDRGVQVSVDIHPLDSDHPNAICLQLKGEADRLTEVIGTSEGGGAVLVSRVDGAGTRLDGEHHHLLVWLKDPGDAGRVEELMPGAKKVCRDGRLLTLRVCGPLDDSTGEILRTSRAVQRYREVPPVMPAPEKGAADRPLFTSAREAAGVALEEDLDLAGLALRYEMNRQGWSKEKVGAHARDILAVMRAGRDRGLSEDLQFSGGIAKQGGAALFRAQRQGETLITGAVGRASAYAMAINEVNASLGIIAAAPTAGGCGVLPGALLATMEELGKEDDDELLTQALLAAGAVGAIFAQRVTFLAELCGCQVESGAGAAMAAAALIWLRGGTLRQSFDGAAITLQNILGMECDPVAGLMEVPCITRNALGAANAVLTADIVLTGVDSVIPLDEVLDAVYETGRMRPVQCSGTGGLAVTQTSRRLAEESRQRHDGEPHNPHEEEIP